jgi:hypothetical protein
LTRGGNNLKPQIDELTRCPIRGKVEEVGEMDILKSFAKARRVKEHEHEFVRIYEHVGYLMILFNPKKEKIAVLTKRAREVLRV